MSRRYGVVRGIEPEERLDFLKQAAHKWVWRTEVVQEAYEAHRGPKLLVRYEELLAETHREMLRVMEWLGLSTAGLETSIDRHAFANAPSGPREFARAARPGLWRENLTGEEQLVVEEIMAPTLDQMGYRSA
jgi:hypothetical protein